MANKKLGIAERKVENSIFNNFMTPDQKIVFFTAESKRMNITQLRGWVHQLIIISSGIIGFTLPVLGRTNLIKNPILLIVALFLLWIVIIYGFCYLLKVLSKENSGLEQRLKLMARSEKKGSREPGRNDYNFYILFSIFAIATFLIILSMVDWKQLLLIILSKVG